MADEAVVDLGIPGVTDAVEVARGGFATVYRARQARLDRVVAVKLIHGTVVDPLGGERFLREVRATGRLSQHPNVAPVYDVGTTSSQQPYLIMPFYPNGSLAQRIERGRGLAEAEAVRIGHTLATTLAYVHSHGVLHRDVKPANVLMSDTDEPLLCDFGVARLTDSSVSMHTTGTSVVTWAYGPPEAFTGGEPTPAWDVYSLAATMYALLTGVPPFVEGTDVNVFTVLNRIGNVDVPDLRERGISPAVADAVRQAMSKSPADRPPSAAAFAELLERKPAAPAAPKPEPVAAPEPLATPEPEPAPVAAPTPAAPEPEPVAAPVAAPPVFAPPAPGPPAPAVPVFPVTAATTDAGWRPAVAAVTLAVVGAVVNLVAAGKPLWRSDSSNAFLGPGWADVQVWFPSAVVLGALALLPRPRLAAEWVVGAGLAYLALDYGGITEWSMRNGSVDWESFAWRTAGASLLLVAVIVAWSAGEQRGAGPFVGHALVALGGAALAVLGMKDAMEQQSPKLYAIVAASAGLLLLLLLRLLLARWRTTAAGALAAAGLTGVVYWTAQAQLINDNGGDNGGAYTAVAGFAVVGAVGVARWIVSSTR